VTSTGIDKARSPDQRIADNTIDITKQIIEDTKVFNATSPEFALGGEQGSSEGSAAGNYLAKSGDIRLGPMGNEFRIVEIIDNTISVSIATPNYVPLIVLNPEGGTPDDLETIVPGESVFLNQEILLQGGNISSDITLKNSSNIITPDGGDLVLAFGEIIRLYYSQLLAAWVVAWFSSNVGGGTSPLTTKGDLFGFDTADARIPVGTNGQVLTANSAVALGVEWATSPDASQWANFPAVSDVDFGTFDGINVDRFLFSVDAGSFANNSDTGFVRSSNGLLANVDFEKSYFWSAAKTTIMSLEQEITNNNSVLSVLATPNGSVPKIKTFALDNTPTIGADIANIDFLALNDAAANVVYAGLQAEIEGISNGLEEGSLFLNARAGGSQTPFIVLNNSADGKISAFRNIFMDIGRNIELGSNKIYTTTDLNNTFISGASSSIEMFVDSAVSAKGTFGSTRLNLENNYFLQTQAVELRNVVADIGGINGTIWYNSTTEKFRGRENGVDVDLVGGGGSQTPILQDVDYDGFDIKDISNVEFRISSTNPPIGSVPAIFHQADSLVFNTPSADNMDFREGGVNFLVMDASLATFTVGTFQALSSTINLGLVSTSIVNFIADVGTNILPNTDGTRTLGDSSAHWDDVFTETLTIKGDGGDTTGSKNTIYGDLGSRLNINNAGSGIKFLTNNVQNFLMSTNTFLQTASIGGLGSAAFHLDTTGATGAFFLHSFGHQNSLGNVVSYTGIQSFAEDITTNSLDGRIEFSVASNSLDSTASNSLPVALALTSSAGTITIDCLSHKLVDVSGMNIKDGTNIEVGTSIGTKIAASSSQKLGFFGATPIVQPTVTGSRGGNIALASLLTDLVSLGLIVDGTSA